MRLHRERPTAKTCSNTCRQRLFRQQRKRKKHDALALDMALAPPLALPEATQDEVQINTQETDNAFAMVLC